MGLASDKAFGYVYSVSEDATFKLSEINSQSVVVDLKPGTAGFKSMLYNTNRNIFILGDAEGYVYIYSQVTVRFLLNKLMI
jgi:hypothetical protein